MTLYGASESSSCPTCGHACRGLSAEQRQLLRQLVELVRTVVEDDELRRHHAAACRRKQRKADA